MTTTTALDLDAIKARHFAARDGEWKVTETQDDEAVVFVDHESIHGAATVLFQADWGVLADAEFIANAHQDVPALAAEVERLRTDNLWLDRHYRQATEADEAMHEKLSDALGLDDGISWDALIDKVRGLRNQVSKEIEETIDADVPGDFERGMEYSAKIARGDA